MLRIEILFTLVLGKIHVISIFSYDNDKNNVKLCILIQYLLIIINSYLN
jgi:hypothetical protein